MNFLPKETPNCLKCGKNVFGPASYLKVRECKMCGIFIAWSPYNLPNQWGWLDFNILKNPIYVSADVYNRLLKLQFFQ